jgi:hypothetical protein
MYIVVIHVCIREGRQLESIAILLFEVCIEICLRGTPLSESVDAGSTNEIIRDRTTDEPYMRCDCTHAEPHRRTSGGNEIRRKLDFLAESKFLYCSERRENVLDQDSFAVSITATVI